MDREPLSERVNNRQDWQGHSMPLIDPLPLPMIEVEGEAHRICSVNNAFCLLLKKTRTELLGKPFAEIVFNGEKCVPLLDQVYETGEFRTHTERDESQPSPSYWLYAMWPTLDADERPVRVVIQLTPADAFRKNAVAMNEALLVSGLRQHELREAAERSNTQLELEIAQRKRVEAVLLKAQIQLLANAEKLEQTLAERTIQLSASIGELEAFSYSLVHDLRAPVRAISGFTRLVLEMPPEDVSPAAGEFLQRVIRAATRMDSLIQDVLSLSQVIRQPIKNDAVDVDALTRALIKEQPELYPFIDDIKVESPLLPMLGHEASLSQCISNLLANAVKFVAEGQRPRVRVWSEAVTTLPTPADGWASSIQPGNLRPDVASVRLWIEDQGIGIALEENDKIFEIFQRLHSSTKYEGTGIGLAIVRKAVERMGGRVGVESAPGQGSRFWLELPKP